MKAPPHLTHHPLPPRPQEPPQRASDPAWFVFQARVKPRIHGDDRSRLHQLFAARVYWTLDHWIWEGHLNTSHDRPTPVFSFVRADGRKASQRAFRYLMEEFFPEIEFRPGAHYRLTCGEVRCINPRHRSRTKPTWAEKGREHPNRRFTDGQVLAVMRAPRGSIRALAREMGIAVPTAYQWRAGQTHKGLWEQVHGRPAPNYRSDSLDVKREYRAAERERARMREILEAPSNQVRAVAARYGMDIKQVYGIRKRARFNAK